jgi:FMN phosphatase YigB (HAD superfamily)
MLDAAVCNSGLERCFAETISVNRVKTYKPSPRVYALGPEILGIPAEEILFVSANSWDAAGAKAFGYKVCWRNREQMPAGLPKMSEKPPLEPASGGALTQRIASLKASFWSRYSMDSVDSLLRCALAGGPAPALAAPC